MSRTSRRRLLVAVVATVAVVAAGAVAVSARSSSGPSYRTATVAERSVDQVLASVGVIEPVHQASVAFPVAGTVRSVDVTVGETVNVGHQLAVLDTTALQRTVDQKQAALDQANLNLQLALDGQTPTGGLSGGTGGSGGGGFGRAAGSGLAGSIRDAQQAVLDAQQAVDAALADAQAALATAQQVCTASSAGGGTTTTTDPTTTTTTDPSGQTCQQALDDALAAQQALADAQSSLDDAVAHLSSLLDAAASTPTTTTTRPSNGGGGASGGGPNGAGTGGAFAGSSSGTGRGSGSGSATGGGSRSSTSSGPSAADLVAYQKQVDAAEIELAAAQQAVAQATIVSPIAGTVVSVGLAEGDAVSAASSTQAIVIVGHGGFEVTSSIPVAKLAKVTVGDRAVVVPDGSTRSIAGQVVGIGLAGDTSGASTTYPVTIALTGDTSTLGNGATAAVEITTKASRRALAVPTSAVTVSGAQATVRRLRDGTVSTVDVQTGAVGQEWIEITSGLEAGDVVVLADLSEPLPGSATSSSNGGGARSGAGFEGGFRGQFPGGLRPGG